MATFRPPCFSWQGGSCLCCTLSISPLMFKVIFMFCWFPTADPPNITSISSNLAVNQTDLVTLNCAADGNPAPSITWTRVSDDSAVTFPLRITGKQDEGPYRCIANNGVGNSSTKDVFISVESKFKQVINDLLENNKRMKYRAIYNLQCHCVLHKNCTNRPFRILDSDITCSS